jgi:predicted molibdopterin-dependent oxidoreductase YjgC
MLQARCESCGACVAYCPTGALDNKMSVNAGRADRLVRTTCAYCGVGCQFDLNVKDDVSGGRILRVTSNTDPSVHSFNAMHLCLKGRYGYDFVHHKDRLTRPRVRRYLLEGEQRPKDRGKWVDVDWETAIEVSAQGLHNAREEFGGESVAVLASGKLTNEENYLLNKLARQVLSTNHIDCASHIYHASVVDGLAEVAGLHGMSNTLDDIASNAQALLVIGSNLTEQHPVFGARIRQAIMRRKVKMVVISPDFINIAEYAAIPLYHRQKTETALLNGLMHIILERGWEDKSAVENQPQGFSEYKIKLARYTPGYVAEITGVSEDSLYQAAEIMALNRPMAVLWSTGVADLATGRGNIQCLVNLQRLLGNLDKSGGGLNPLRGQNNIQGACDMGALPGMLPGYQSVADPVICQKFEQAWGVQLPSQPGLNAVEFLAAARDGRLKAIYILGEDILNTSADGASVRRSLESCDFTVLQEILPFETTRYADVLLPGVSFVEKNGTFTSTERRIQTVQQAIKPIGKARLDWEIISDLAQRIIAIGGRNLEQAPFSAWDYASVDQIQQEIAQLTPIYAGISPDRLAGGEQVHWPVISAMHPGSPLLKTELGGWEAVEQISLPERIIV